MQTTTSSARVPTVLLALLPLILSGCASRYPADTAADYVLVTPEEYARALEGFSSPEAAVSGATRSGSEVCGPLITVVDPPLQQGKGLHNPLKLDVRWSVATADNCQGTKAKISTKSLKVIYAVGNEREDKTALLKTFCRFSSKETCRLDETGLRITSLPQIAPGKARFELHLADTMGRKTVQDFVVEVM